MSHRVAEYPKRKLSNQPFVAQIDMIEKLLIEKQNQPAPSYTSNSKPLAAKKGFSKTYSSSYGHHHSQPQHSVSRGSTFVYDQQKYDQKFDHTKPVTASSSYGVMNLNQERPTQFGLSVQIPNQTQTHQAYTGPSMVQQQSQIPSSATTSMGSSGSSPTIPSKRLGFSSISSGSSSTSTENVSQPDQSLWGTSKVQMFDPFKPVELSSSGYSSVSASAHQSVFTSTSSGTSSFGLSEISGFKSNNEMFSSGSSSIWASGNSGSRVFNDATVWG
ncbi:hypothetical protein G9P44_004240 [Scheffersomyces stipitis]|nr:hypothetical protein G9P44_004240 [Scheffersomyces stipitis]